jgi:single-stranded-DNA-specific exonuclease
LIALLRDSIKKQYVYIFMSSPQWQMPSPSIIPQEFLEAVKSYLPDQEGQYLAQLLWQRGIQDLEKLPGFLDSDCYQPISPFAFGQEMKRAVERLSNARQAGEKVTIWGDFDADGITSTSVLWDGLGQFFRQQEQLNYYIPNRLTESHGLNNPGIEKLAIAGTKLIVTCDTGSTNLSEIEYVTQLGIDIIVTDHHTLPEDRPPVISIINPRYFAENHPLYNLSGVAVAYKLVEALYQTLPDIPQQPLEELLDLVAIGLVADLVQLSGDCRYLAQQGIKQLKKQANPATATRPGVARLLELCRRSGDRPTDISFGIGPRINAVSRIHGDASFCVELLTSRDRDRTFALAEETELANTRRKSVQKKTIEEVKQKLERQDLSTTSVIVLEDPQWQGGVLGLVAGQIAQEYGRPTILLSSGVEEDDTSVRTSDETFLQNNSLARGSARSVNNIDLYELVNSQRHLLDRFGGHPFAAGLSLLLENLSLFREGIDRQLKQTTDINLLAPTITADLIVTVAELGKQLFWELQLIEPCGMGNPTPKLLIENCWFERPWMNNTQDFRGNKVQYLKTTFNLCDRSKDRGFPGIWWGHNKDELPQGKICDVIVELDYNSYGEGRYEVRLLEVRTKTNNESINNHFDSEDCLLDYRAEIVEAEKIDRCQILEKCPIAWSEIQKSYQNALASSQKLALAYQVPAPVEAEKIWQQLVGMVKYLSRTGKGVSKTQLQEKLFLSDRTLDLGLKTLARSGFTCHYQNESWYFHYSSHISSEADLAKLLFWEAIKEEQFQRQYFSQVSLSTLQEQIRSQDN